MSYWPWWLSAPALASVAIAHFLFLRRMLAVSGRFTALVDRMRWGKPQTPLSAPSEEELLAAIRAATLEAFGPDSVSEPPPPSDHSQQAPKRRSALPPVATWIHVLFLGCVALGGFIASSLTETDSVVMGLRSVELTSLAGSGAGQLALLAVGGVCVGFGTRMAGGCTSGHGLCGVSRFQPGSLLATAAFFGGGVLVSFALMALT